MASVEPGQRVRPLHAVNIVFVGTAAADRQDQLPALEDVGLGIWAVGEAGLVTANVSEQQRVGEGRRNRGRQRQGQSIGSRKRIAGALQGSLRTGGLEILAGEALAIPATGQLMSKVDAPIQLGEDNILIERAEPG